MNQNAEFLAVRAILAGGFPLPGKPLARLKAAHQIALNIMAAIGRAVPDDVLPPAHGLATPCRVGGVNFQSIDAAALYYDVGDGTIRNYIKRHPLGGAPFVLDTTKAPKPVVVERRSFTSIYKAARAFGVREKTIRSYVKRHPLGAAPFVVGAAAVPKPVVVEHQSFESIKAASRTLGVSALTISKYVWRHPLGDAPFVCHELAQPCRVGGIDFPSIGAAARHYGVSNTPIRNWLKAHDGDEPFVLCELAQPCRVGGVGFPSHTAAARHYGVSKMTISKWLKTHNGDDPFTAGRAPTTTASIPRPRPIPHPDNAVALCGAP